MIRTVRDITLCRSMMDPYYVEIRLGGGSYRDLTPAECRELAYQLHEAAREAERA